MRAVVVRAYGDPDVLRLESAPLPRPGRGEVRIRVSRSGMAMGDVLRRQGLAGARRPPFTPGYDVVGAIDALGPGVTGWTTGRRVAAYVEHGGYSEAVCISIDALAEVPDALTDAEAVALVLNYGTAFQMITRTAGVRTGQSLVVTSAAGGVGTAVLDIARAFGIRAVGLASPSKHALVRGYGAAPVDYRAGDMVAQVRSHLGGGADAVLDGVGGGGLWRSRAMAARRGRLVLFGVTDASRDGKPRVLGVAPTTLAVAAIHLLPGPSLRIYVSTDEQKTRRSQYAADVRKLFDLARQGRIKPLIHREIPLAEVAEGHRELAQGGVVGKIVIAVA